MAAIRIVTLSWNPASGGIRPLTGLAPYLKRNEPVRLIVKDADLADADDLQLSVKPADAFDGTPLLQITGWTWHADELTWTADTVISSAGIDTLLAANGSTPDDLASADCVLDIAALDDGGDILAQSDTLELKLKNNVTRSGDPSPQPGAGEREFYAGVVTGYADGTWADDLVTAGKTFGLYKFVNEDGQLVQFILKSSSAATALPGIRRPDDYNASTNAFVFVQVAG